MNSQPNVPNKRRRGLLTLESLLIIPLVLIVLFSIVEFSFLLIGQQAIASAANVAAREAALPSTDITAAENAVDAALTGWAFRDDVRVLVFVNGVRDDGVNNELLNAVTGDEVTVEVQVFMAHAAPDLLKFITLSFGDNRLISTYTTIRE